MENRERMQLRLPAEIKAWIADQAAKTGASQNSEVVRAIRERMERLAATETTTT